MQHTLLRNPQLKGWEYGMLRALEEEIVRQTNAQVIDIPEYGDNALVKRAGHGMRLDILRSILPKRSLRIDTDVLWCVLMGPENHLLDLFMDWDIKAKHRVVYIFDTLPPQFRLVRKLYSGDQFNIRITSFADAVPALEALTGKKWFAIEQGVPCEIFKPVPLEERLIHFSSYGRRFPVFHNVLLDFCRKNNLYYDFTTHDAKHPTAPEEELYRQYAWHICHSVFTISWPVELTNPQRAGNLHPITCRWFEAAAAGTCVIGQQPGNDSFDEILHPGMVTEINPFGSPEETNKKLELVWSSRANLIERAQRIQQSNVQRWTWKDRVHRMINLIIENS